MSRVGGERAVRAPPPPPALRRSPAPPSWRLRSEMDLVERARGSLSRSTLLLRESILEADEDGGWRRGEAGEHGGEGTGRGWWVGESQRGWDDVDQIWKQEKKDLIFILLESCGFKWTFNKNQMDQTKTRPPSNFHWTSCLHYNWCWQLVFYRLHKAVYVHAASARLKSVFM